MGMILRSWLDRPLILAGNTYTIKRQNSKILRDKETHLPILETKLTNKHNAIAIIPDIAIHLDREKNTHGKINPEQMMQSILGLNIDEDKKIETILQKIYGSNHQDIDGFELYFIPFILMYVQV